MVKGHQTVCSLHGHNGHSKKKKISTYILLPLLTTYVGSATVSFNNLVIVAQENSTNQTADILVDQLQPHVYVVP